MLTLEAVLGPPPPTCNFGSVSLEKYRAKEPSASERTSPDMNPKGYSNSVLTLYGLIVAPILSLFKSPVFGIRLLTTYLSPNVALKCSFELRLSPEVENGSLNKLKNWSLNNLIETPIS